MENGRNKNGVILARTSVLSDSGSQNGSKPRLVRDNTMIERNKAKLAELAEKKLNEKREREAQE